MTSGATHSFFRRYRLLISMALLVSGLSLIQIGSGGIGRLFQSIIGEPMQWTVSYTQADNQTVAKRVAAPEGNLFVEGRAMGTIRIEMDLGDCRTYDRYRFWVGPYGSDDTDRQPGKWTLFTRGDEGDWMQADNEQITDVFLNNRWYTFSLHVGKACVRHVRWSIARLFTDDIFRLYRFQIYERGPFSLSQ